MADLHVDFLGKRLAGPVIAASGTFGFGPEYAGIEDLRVLGGISGKGLTLNGQPGNEGERLYETPSGLMNSIGLQNPGVQHFIDHELPAMRRCGTTVWANLGGHTIEENVEGVQMLCAAGVDFIELNISCPNVKQGGLAFGIRAADAGEVVSAVRKVCTVPLIVKLSPQAESIPEMCKAVEAAGADAISLCNTFQACAIDLEKRRPVFNNTFAGLSGPAVRPIALRMVWQAVGYYMVMYMASMSSVPASLYESANLDGAGRLTQFFQITIPLIWTNIRTTLTFFIISTINMAFLFVKAMTSGGPNGASDVALSYMYSQKDAGLYGYSMAIGVVIFLFSFALSACVNKVTNRDTLEF